MAEPGIENQSVELSHYWRVLRRRWWVVGCAVTIGLAIAGAYLFVMPKSVTATAVVNINAISSEPFNNTKPDSQLIDPQTEVQLARSSQVLGQIAKSMPGGRSMLDVRNNTAVTAVANATVVQVAFTAPSRTIAVQTADSIAKGYLEYRGQLAIAKVAAVTDKLTKQRDDLRKSLVQANDQLAKAQKGSVAATQAESDRQLINLELNALLTQMDQMGSVDTNGGTLISNAEDNAIDVSPDGLMTMATGGLAGLIFGLIGAFVVAAGDRRVFTSRDLSAAGGGDVLSECGATTADLPATGTDLDDIRSLRERLFATMSRGGVLVVADLTRHAGPSDIGINLAVSAAEGNHSIRVVIPDNEAGFLEDLKASLQLKQVRTDSGATTYASGAVPGLVAILPSHPDRARDLSASTLASILQNDAGDFLMTVVALPPTATRSLRLAAGRLGHSIIVIANRRGTRTPDIRRLAADLHAVGAVIHGSVLVPRSRSLRQLSRQALGIPKRNNPEHRASASEQGRHTGHTASADAGILSEGCGQIDKRSEATVAAPSGQSAEVV